MIDVWKLPAETEDLPKYLSAPIYSFTTSTSTICKTCCIVERENDDLWITVPKDEGLVVIRSHDSKYSVNQVFVGTTASDFRAIMENLYYIKVSGTLEHTKEQLETRVSLRRENWSNAYRV